MSMAASASSMTSSSGSPSLINHRISELPKLGDIMPILISDETLSIGQVSRFCVSASGMRRQSRHLSD